jgi:HEPN domain-containing protein
MNDLSYTQECFLCSLNGKGSSVSELVYTRVPACLIVGGIMELFGQGLIAYGEKNRLVIAKPWNGALPYLKPLYETIASFKKPQAATGVADFYLSDLKQRPLSELISTFAASLVAAGCAEELAVKGLLKETTKYVPKPESVTRVIEKIRTEFLEDGTITDETFCLAAMLDRSEIIRDYFSKVEAGTFKARMKEVRKSDAYASVKEIVDFMDGAFVAFFC